MSARQASVAVVGAGIAGLTAAYRLKQAGFKPVVFESADYAGGRIKSIRRDGWTFDVGAFIYLGSYQQSVDLIREIGLEDQLGRFDAYGAMPRDGRLHYLDFNKPLPTLVGTPYISVSSKLKVLKLGRFLAANWKHLNYQDVSGVAALDNDTVRSYCERELNAELRDYIASVVVRGPWLVNIDTASVAQLLWTMKNFFKPYFYGLDEGMDALPRALAAKLDVRLQHGVQHIADRGDGVELSYTKPDGGSISEKFDACIITTTADRVLSIVPQVSGVQRQFFESTSYVTCVNTHIALAKRPANPATYIMASEREAGDLCGVIVDHLKARGRVPTGKGMLTVFCRHEWGVANFDATDERVMSQVLKMLRPWYGDLSADVEDYEIGRWAQVVPFMGRGRFRQMATYQKSIDPQAAIQFANDLLPIGGVNAALVSGEQAAKRVIGRFA